VDWVAGILWIGWQASRGLSGNLPMDWVADIRGICNTREHLPFHDARAFQRIGHNHAWDILAFFEELAAAWLGRFLVSAPLPENVKHKAALIHGPPAGVAFAVDRQKAFLQGHWSLGRGRWRWS